MKDLSLHEMAQPLVPKLVTKPSEGTQVVREVAFHQGGTHFRTRHCRPCKEQGQTR